LLISHYITHHHPSQHITNTAPPKPSFLHSLFSPTASSYHIGQLRHHSRSCRRYPIVFTAEAREDKQDAWAASEGSLTQCLSRRWGRNSRDGGVETTWQAGYGQWGHNSRNGGWRRCSRHDTGGGAPPACSGHNLCDGGPLVPR